MLDVQQNKTTHFYDVNNELFVPLGGVTTTTATPQEISIGYIKDNISRKVPRIQQLIGYMEVKGKDNPIILIGGGPSLKNPEVLAELKQLAKNNPTIACGSSHDWCIENGITPTYATVVDPDPISANYYKKVNSDTIYLVASQCHPCVFELLSNYKVAMWHCYGEYLKEFLDLHEPNYVGVGGGCTIGLRSISIAILLGYTNIHFFGFDSCLDTDGTGHAYSLSTEDEVLGLIGENGKIHKVRLGLDGPGEKVYNCMGYQLAQMDHFNKLYMGFNQIFTPTFHGGGLLAHCLEIMKEQLNREQRN
jgi:hypothetical protein